MKVLLLNDIGTATGGAELQMLSLRQGLRDRGHEVRLLTSQVIPIEGSKLLADDVCFGSNTRLQVLTQTINPSAYLALRRALQTFQPDVVHVRIFMGQLSPLILPLLKDIPCLYQAAMYRAICPKGTKVLPDGNSCTSRAGLSCLRHRCLTPQSWAMLMVQRQLLLIYKTCWMASIRPKPPRPPDFLKPYGFNWPRPAPRQPLADPDAIEVQTDQLTALLTSLMPVEWQQGSASGDFDVIASMLDQMIGATRAGEYELAESARLEAYAIMEVGPEARLIVFAPQLKLRLEELFWNGQGEAKGLAYLIKNQAPLSEIKASRAALDAELATAQQLLSAESAPVAVITNAAVIV
ncbi:MAG: glycosyltransferase, partial [Leptolyngbyaceae cyanobacterium SL_7_1]|nr:glycosyltransferase [Leptolyngbyaceae cyanobacterium SL_7_1]